MSRCRRSLRIDAFLERLHTQATYRVDEQLLIEAPLPIDLDDARNGFGHLALPDRRPDHLAERGAAVDRAAERKLVPLLAVLIDAKNADVTDMVVTAGVHAAGDLDLDIAQIVEIVEVIEARLDLL